MMRVAVCGSKNVPPPYFQISSERTNRIVVNFRTSENDSDANLDCNYLVLEKSIWFPDSHLKDVQMCSIKCNWRSDGFKMRLV